VEIGRHARFRSLFLLRKWGFEALQPHHLRIRFRF
jgi:hypothetical protein